MRRFALATLFAAFLTQDFALAAESLKKPLAFTRTHTLEPVWSGQVGVGSGKEYLRLTPSIGSSVVVAADVRGRIYAFAKENGQPRWNTSLPEKVSSGTATNGTRLLVASREGIVFALDASSGSEKWRSQVTSEVLTPPVSADGVVIVHANDGQVFALEAETGKRLWVYQSAVPALTLRGHSGAVIAKGKVITGFANGKLVALSLRDGKLLWEASIAQPRGRTELDRMVDIDADPLVVGETVYSVSYQGRVAAVDINNGRQIWSREESSYSGMTADTRYLYLSDAEGNVLALDRSDGATLWIQDKLGGHQLSAPGVLGDLVLVGDHKGLLYGLSKEDGSLVTRIRLSDLANKAAGKSIDLWSDYENPGLPLLKQENTAIRAPLLPLDDGLVAMSSDGLIVALRAKRVQEK